MRLTVARLRRVVKADLPIGLAATDLARGPGTAAPVLRFARPASPDSSGIQWLRSRGDYGAGRLVLLVIALFEVGAHCLEHLRYLAHDPLVARLCGLARLPYGP
jgi:hypothetical protein